ncbi:MAG: hypothetical protein M3Q69_00445 [Acidobacteriota bacterium]|nr:hypothetical protein [Acidobacteriota bacterium]
MDEQKIRARFDAFAAAWNAHDVAAMTGCFVDREDGWRFLSLHPTITRAGR